MNTNLLVLLRDLCHRDHCTETSEFLVYLTHKEEGEIGEEKEQDQTRSGEIDSK